MHQGQKHKSSPGLASSVVLKHTVVVFSFLFCVIIYFSFSTLFFLCFLRTQFLILMIYSSIDLLCACNLTSLTYSCSFSKSLSLQVGHSVVVCASACLRSVQGRGLWWRQTHRQTDRQTDADRRAGQGLVLLFSAEAWLGDCWLMQNRNTGVEHLEGGRERESEWGSEWKPKRDWWQDREEERWCAREKGGRKEGERERHYRASVSQQVDGASGWGYDTSLLL